MIEHMVMFKFKEQTTKEQKEEGMNRLKALAKVIPGIVDLQTNHNFSDRSKGYGVGLTVRFESRDSLETYGPHPEHQKVVTYLKEVGLEDTIVVDFEIQE
ncbi:Dabb family protein [Pseudalkalibacillus caeni]|uniref:Dabb family protein n=1 Tax=Exobacillus caeni TaxID=2574798 RepID=A0A5R9F399_9BACL|nr:Dabb family protein [Pseudalkalibacillus caeni]TLS38162.1 Dabb family protein [Pseudalkalibacillus caeni]